MRSEAQWTCCFSLTAFDPSFPIMTLRIAGAGRCSALRLMEQGFRSGGARLTPGFKHNGAEQSRSGLMRTFQQPVKVQSLQIQPNTAAIAQGNVFIGYVSSAPSRRKIIEFSQLTCTGNKIRP